MPVCKGAWKKSGSADIGTEMQCLDGSRRELMNLFGVIALCATFFLSGAQAAPAPGVVEAAKKEAKLVWWTSGTSADSQNLIKKFNERYPFIQVEFWNAPGEDISEKIWAEHNANRFNWDVSLGADIQLHYDELVKRGIVVKIARFGLEVITEGDKDCN